MPVLCYAGLPDHIRGPAAGITSAVSFELRFAARFEIQVPEQNWPISGVSGLRAYNVGKNMVLGPMV